MRISSVTSRVLVLTAAAHLLAVESPALAQTERLSRRAYGVDSAGNQRPQSLNTCLPQSIGSCE